MRWLDSPLIIRKTRHCWSYRLFEKPVVSDSSIQHICGLFEWVKGDGPRLTKIVVFYRVPGSVGTISELTRSCLFIEQMLMHSYRRTLERITSVALPAFLQQLAQDLLGRSRQSDYREEILAILKELKCCLELRESDGQLVMSGLGHDPPRAV